MHTIVLKKPLIYLTFRRYSPSITVALPIHEPAFI
jgi:hypothetical protein